MLEHSTDKHEAAQAPAAMDKRAAAAALTAMSDGENWGYEHGGGYFWLGLEDCSAEWPEHPADLAGLILAALDGHEAHAPGAAERLSMARAWGITLAASMGALLRTLVDMEQPELLERLTVQDAIKTHATYTRAMREQARNEGAACTPE